MVSLSRTLCLGLFVAALGLAGAASGQNTPKDERPAHRIEAANPPQKPQANASSVPRPAGARISPEKPQAPAQKPKASKPKGGESFPFGTFADWVIVVFTGALTYVAFKQHKLETGLAKDADQQRADVKASIAEATRAATAMEKLAKSTAETVEATHSVASGTTLTGTAMVASANAMEIMAQATQRSADAAQASATALGQSVDLTTASLRAYVSVTGANFMPAANGKGPGAEVRFQNTGQTPARDVVIIVKIDFIRAPFDKPLGELDPAIQPSKQTILSGDKSTGFAYCRRDLLAAETEAMKNGEAAIVVWGRIDYKDFIGRSQWATFAFFVGGRFGFTGGKNFALWHEGNEST